MGLWPAQLGVDTFSPRWLDLLRVAEKLDFKSWTPIQTIITYGIGRKHIYQRADLVHMSPPCHPWNWKIGTLYSSSNTDLCALKDVRGLQGASVCVCVCVCYIWRRDSTWNAEIWVHHTLFVIHHYAICYCSTHDPFLYFNYLFFTPYSHCPTLPYAVTPIDSRSCKMHTVVLHASIGNLYKWRYYIDLILFLAFVRTMLVSSLSVWQCRYLFCYF